MSSSSSSSSSWSFSLLAVLRSAWCSYQNATTSTSRWALQLLLAFGAAIYTIYKITHHFYYLYANKYRRNINDIPLPIPPSVASKAEHTTPPSRHHTGLYYDYIIVGAGSAGCVLANRLSADPNNKVLLIEAGGDDSVLFAGIPVAAGKLQRGKHDWGYKTVPQKYSHNAMVDKRSNWPRGKIMGGCSTLNYMIWVRGDAEDYNTWSRMGCNGWSYDDVLPHFKSIENASNIGKHPLRGTEGEIHVNHLSSPNAGVDAFIKGCASIGIPSNPDYNAESMIGAAPIQTSTHHGWRWNGASAFIAPIMNRSNLTLLPWTHTTRLIFEGNRVTGVAIVRGKNEVELRACREQIIGCNKEVIVCAGAIGSPHLLLLSGIGPREELQRQGIPCVADLPVGRNLQDHLCLPVPFESKIPSLSEAHIGLWDIWSYLRSGTGVLSSVFVEGTAFLRTGVRSDLPQPDLQYHFAPATLSAENWDNFNVKPEIRDNMLKAVPGFTQILAPTLIRPASVGTITLASPDPLIHPLIDPHYLEDKRDVDVLIAGCKIACRIAKTDAMQKVVGKLLLHVMDYGNPYNFETQEDQYWEYWVRFASATLYHPAGTCKMGAANDPTAVVTPDLRVKGIQGLRVADASIMPEVISGNTNAPSMMIGSKCAELIRLSTSVPIPPPSSATAPKRPVQVIQQSKL